MVTPRDEFAAHCVELLAPLGEASVRRMFGGHGIYLGGLMIGLIAAEQLYLKTDAETLPRWQAAGGQPFVYSSRRKDAVKATATSYWTPPEEALESPARMRPWGRLALEAALRKAATARPKSRPAATRRSASGKPR